MYSKFIPESHEERYNRLHRWKRSYDGAGDGEGDNEPETAAEIEARLIARYGDASKALGVLAGDNARYREKNRVLRTRVSELEGQTPKEGQVVLTAEQANIWNAVQPLLTEHGGSVEGVKTKLKEGDDLKVEVAKRDREKLIDDVAGVAGYGGKTVLRDLVENKGLHVEIRTVKEDGKDVQQAVARKAADQNATLVPLSDYISQNHADYLPALQAGATGGTGGGVPFPPMGSGGSGAPSDRASDYLRKQNEAAQKRTNPLRAMAATS